MRCIISSTHDDPSLNYIRALLEQQSAIMSVNNASEEMLSHTLTASPHPLADSSVSPFHPTTPLALLWPAPLHRTIFYATSANYFCKDFWNPPQPTQGSIGAPSLDSHHILSSARTSPVPMPRSNVNCNAMKKRPPAPPPERIRSIGPRGYFSTR